MSDKKISQLTALTTPANDDLLPIVDDPAGSPITKKITWANIKAAIKSYYDSVTATLTNKTLTSPTITNKSSTGTDSGTETLTNKTLTSPLFQGSLDGWISANETWTYASATTITVPSGAASKYQKGDKIKLTQTTVKYFYIISVADTVLTVTGGTDYTVADEAITDNYYSHQENPIGFPHWFNWTPSYSASGSMTYTSVTTNIAKFRIVGQSCIVLISSFGTTGGAADSTIYVHGLPVAVNAGNIQMVVGAGVEAGVVGGVCFNQSTTELGFRKYDNSDWALSADMRCRAQIQYPI
jgi:hypothetical protein